MYTSTYEIEKLAELRRDELVRNAEIDRMLQSTRRRVKKTARVVSSSSVPVKESTCRGCA